MPKTKKTNAGATRSTTTRKTGTKARAQAAPVAAPEPAPAPAKAMSALDAAAKVLAETRQPMNCQEMITAMAEKGYWTSPGGKTPAATLYSAILRELTAKGEKARFRKVERGRFALAAPQA